MTFSIIAFIINIGTALMNVWTARRNRRKSDELRAVENELLDYAMRLPDIESEIIKRERERWKNRRFIVTADVLDPEHIADPELRREIILRRMFADYCPN
nr:MAG TPA: holin [Caudoviricetes sp.]